MANRRIRPSCCCLVIAVVGLCMSEPGIKQRRELAFDVSVDVCRYRRTRMQTPAGIS